MADHPQPVFNLPWSTNVSGAGLETGVPSVTAGTDTVSAPMTQDLALTPAFGQIHRVQVNAFDDMSVLVNGLDSSGSTEFSIRLVKGLPFEYVAFTQPLRLSATGDAALSPRHMEDGRKNVTFTVHGQVYEIVVSDNASLQKQGTSVVISPGTHEDHVTLIALPPAADAKTQAAYESAAKSQVTGTSAAFSTSGNSVLTTLSYKTSDGRQTIHLVLPAQKDAGALTAGDMGHFATIRGTAVAVPGNTISYTQALPNHADISLPMPAEDGFFKRAKLEGYLGQAAKEYLSSSGASYNGGKELFRLANLLSIAHASHSATEPTFKDALHSQLVDWLTYSPNESSKYFAYDGRVRGLVAVTPEFGSDTFNDHHFHYGYFLYASATLAQYDPSFVTDYGQMVNLVAGDIATTDTSSQLFPRLRTYDPYEGHSWADGFGQFADGNNQESVSEAANAWYSLMEWGKVTHNQSMELTGEWLYANETSAALTYYFNTGNNPGAFPPPYAHHEATILWGGKSDWATFFSANAEAKHIILMLPFSGGSLYLNTGNNLGNDLAALNGELSGKAPQNYADIVLMARALTDPHGATAGFSDNLSVDNSNSLAYVYYWLGLAGQGRLAAQP